MKKIFSILWFIFVLPGRYLLWDRYMHPPKGQIFQTARQRRSVPHLIFYSLIGWVLFIILLSYIFEDVSKNSQSKELIETSQINVSNEQVVKKPQSTISSSTRNQVF